MCVTTRGYICLKDGQRIREYFSQKVTVKLKDSWGKASDQSQSLGQQAAGVTEGLHRAAPAGSVSKGVGRQRAELDTHSSTEVRMSHTSSLKMLAAVILKVCFLKSKVNFIILYLVHQNPEVHANRTSSQKLCAAGV